MIAKTLVIPPNALEHELFRACLQMVVGVEQRHSQKALDGYARTLRELAVKHLSTSEFA